MFAKFMLIDISPLQIVDVCSPCKSAVSGANTVTSTNSFIITSNGQTSILGLQSCYCEW